MHPESLYKKPELVVEDVEGLDAFERETPGYDQEFKTPGEYDDKEFDHMRAHIQALDAKEEYILADNVIP